MITLLIGIVLIAVGLIAMSQFEIFSGVKTYILGGLTVLGGALEQSGVVAEAVPPEYTGMAVAGVGFLVVLVSKLTRRA